MNQQVSQLNDGSLRSFLEEESRVIREAHFSGAPGSEIVQRRTGLIDRFLREAHHRREAAAPAPCLVAVGGYGRGELNPYSDIDIMFLCRDEADRGSAVELLYLLWDAGMDLGYSVRTINECTELARQDIKIRTSLLESRLIAGDPALYASFLRTMQSAVFYWKPSEFVTQKISERNATRLKFGGSLYLREPNIKEGTGGLRDAHIALWIAFVHFQSPSLQNLITKGVISEGQYGVFLRSRNFFWRLRNEMHYLSGRKNDHLTFDLQEQAAKDFGFRDSAHLLAVERFMKAYFIHARNVKEFSNIVIEAALPRPPKRWFERTRTMGPFSLVGKTLVLREERDCCSDISLLMQAFRIAQSHHAVFSDRMKAAVRSCRLGEEALQSARGSEIFLEILNDPDNVSETLNLMKDLRFLGRYIPEFRPIQALARHDYYHLYAVDEHILLAIRNLEKLWSGMFPSLTTLREAFSTLKKRWVLFLAVLIHDLGKAYRRDHDSHGVKIAERVLGRLGVSGDDRSRILFLVRHHVAMSSLSQRRELSDRKVIADFSRLVQDRQNLAMLYVLTYADISAVNPGAWTQWKAALLQDLYLKTLAFFDSSELAAEGMHARLVLRSTKIKEAAAGLFPAEEIDSFLVSMPDQYILYTSTQKVIDHLHMMQRLSREKLVIQERHYPEKGYTELTVCAYDAYGMFYRTAGAIAAKNLNILRAQVYTSRSGVMIDTFQITDPEGRLCDYSDAWESVRTALRASLMSGSKPPEPGLYTAGRRIPGEIVPAIEFDNETSEAFTIIDVTARDMVGFLYRITKTLYELNLDIGSAKIVTEGARVMDSFYVADLLHKKITDTDRLEKIREALRKVVE